LARGERSTRVISRGWAKIHFMTGVTRSRGARRAARARPPATSRLLLAACYAVFLAAHIPASLAVDVPDGTALLAAVNDGTVGSIRLVANVTTPFAWTQAGVFITRDLVIESDTDVCGGDGCHVFGHDSRDFVRVANGATVTMRKIILDDHGDTVAPFSYEGGAVRVVNGTLVAEDCKFTDNVGLYGGAVDVGVDGFARFERCVFAGNVAASQNADDKYKAGGAVRFAGNGLITDSTFRSNQGAEGAAVHVANGATVRFERTVFVDNEDPSANGGANHLRVVEASLVQLFDCAFTTSNVLKNGREMYADASSTIELSPYTPALEAQKSGPGSFVRWSLHVLFRSRVRRGRGWNAR